MFSFHSISQSFSDVTRMEFDIEALYFSTLKLRSFKEGRQCEALALAGSAYVCLLFFPLSPRMIFFILYFLHFDFTFFFSTSSSHLYFLFAFAFDCFSLIPFERFSNHNIVILFIAIRCMYFSDPPIFLLSLIILINHDNGILCY